MKRMAGAAKAMGMKMPKKLAAPKMKAMKPKAAKMAKKAKKY